MFPWFIIREKQELPKRKNSQSTHLFAHNLGSLVVLGAQGFQVDHSQVILESLVVLWGPQYFHQEGQVVPKAVKKIAVTFRAIVLGLFARNSCRITWVF